nr:hypothetical protein Iba_chr09aCG5560 [Ipomoea batatas]
MAVKEDEHGWRHEAASLVSSSSVPSGCAWRHSSSSGRSSVVIVVFTRHFLVGVNQHQWKHRQWRFLPTGQRVAFCSCNDLQRRGSVLTATGSSSPALGVIVSINKAAAFFSIFSALLSSTAVAGDGSPAMLSSSPSLRAERHGGNQAGSGEHSIGRVGLASSSPKQRASSTTKEQQRRISPVFRQCMAVAMESDRGRWP